MGKNIKFRSITNEKEFCSLLKQFSVTGILKSTYEISKEIFFKNCSIKTLKQHVSEYDSKTGKLLEQDIIIQPWQFPDLIYKSIKYSNDYRGDQNLSRNKFLLILCITNEYMESQTIPLTNELHSELDISSFTYGFGAEQFKYQTTLICCRNLIRELYIIFSLTKKQSSIIKPDEIVKEEIGVEWQDLIVVLYGIFIDSLFHQDINEAVNYLNLESSKNKYEIFKKATDHYSIDYSKIRNNSLERQVFYVKPYIRTQRDNLITASVYLNLFIVEHAVFWIIRDHYFNKTKNEQQTFTNEFGHLFEYYLKELLEHFHVNHQKIKEESKSKRTDWLLKMGKYNILIEQKSTIFPLNIKQQLTDFKSYKKEIRKIVYKAIQQLNETENDLHIENPIKKILCYDNYIYANILPNIFEEEDCKVKNDGRYFIANIMEIEMFIELGMTKYDIFEKVIAEMLRRNVNDNTECLSLFKIMRDIGYSTNSYWGSPIFDEYKQLLIDIKNSYILFKEKQSKST